MKGKTERRADRKRRRARRRALHTPAGTLTIDPEAPAPKISVCAYGPDGLVEGDEVDSEAIAALRQRWPVTWVHVVGLGSADLVTAIGETFEIHRLALADVLHTDQRAKLSRWGDVTQVVVRMPEDVGSSSLEQLSLFVGSNFVISFEERDGDLFHALRKRIRERAGLVRDGGSDFLAYAILDVTIDAYFPVLERIGDALEQIEDALPGSRGLELAPRLRGVKHELLGLRHSLWPLREVLSALVAGECPYVREETRNYLRDCQDHCAQLLDLVATDRERTADLADLQLALASQRLNEVMKVLTVMATVFIPLTFVSSIYGMNFDPDSGPLNMPELRWAYGYPFSLGLMGMIAVALLVYFRRRGWI